MIVDNLTELVTSSQRILLLQGPIGPFFKHFADWLVNVQGKYVYKLNFNAGDKFYFSSALEQQSIIDYRDTFENFEAFLLQLCQENEIDALVCFGDTRPYHQVAKRVSEQLQCSFWAFEEGYFRPHYVTLEKEGVNAFSPLPRDEKFFLDQLPNLIQPKQLLPVAKGFCPMAWLASCYYAVACCNKKDYPNYRHHRIYNLRYYIKLWVTSGIKRIWYLWKDRQFEKQVTQQKFGDFYILPLQVYDDSQVRVHCDFDSVEQFLIYVLDSFVQNAPSHLTLIVKHHPMDRGFISYQSVIDRYLKRYPQLKNRLFYIHDVPMPILLRYGKGMVTLNSTSGLSALIHNMPVITLGSANYDIPGITHQGSLEEFWNNPQQPNQLAFHAYHLYHLNKTQINGSFYNKVILPKYKLSRDHH
ncbi:capsule biosynthesis protein [Gallibacterium anatis]|uniref:capsule biosynthesis protein n=1 Tax=Gallibacterium anatis TaxID=750 RepID=UPI0005320D6B|nr:capsule biosynthesis protein [Gallibacterium anatis]KGQ27202.1 capsule biosynthesis protein [Gallibacterium anatis]